MADNNIQLLQFLQEGYDAIFPCIVIIGIIEFMYSDRQKVKARNAFTNFYEIFRACLNFCAALRSHKEKENLYNAFILTWFVLDYRVNQDRL